MCRRLLILLLAAALLTPCRGEEAAPARRPTVGLVLGGGGALGIAHVGVLRVLEELRIPIDFIGGTSMGSIIGGLYASGMSPDEIQAFLERQNWDEVMSDETPRQELFFRRKLDDQRYLFELGVKRGRLTLGAGVAAGQKFNNLLQFETLRTVAVTNFDQLPIPFRAVATDLVTGRPHVLDHGSLARAMRASMAVPGAFTPVTVDGHLMVDGGIVANLPVDVVKAMGADIIIAVDVGSAAEQVNEESLRSIGGILGRTYAIAQRPEQLEQYQKADVGIQPNLAGFTATQFDQVAAIVPLGEQAARRSAAALARHGVGEEAFARYLRQQRRPPPAALPLSSVTVSGNQRVSEAIIRGRIRSRPGANFDQATVEADLRRIYGLGEFEQIQAGIQPAADGASALNFTATEKPWGPTYFKYGLQLRTDFDKDAEWGMLLNLTRMSLNPLGAEWRNEAQIGSVQSLQSEFYQPLDTRGLLFLAPSVLYHSELQDVYEDGRQVAEYDVKRFEARVDFGIQLRQYAELRAGPLWGSGQAQVETGLSDLPEVDEDYAGAVVSLAVDRQDRTLFAREGYYFKAEGQFASESLGGDRSFERVTGVFREQHSWRDHTVTLGLQGGTSLGSELPAYRQFGLGGPFGFAGLAENQFRGDYQGIASLGYRYRLTTLPSAIGRAVYAIARLDVGNVWLDEVDAGDLRTGGALGIGADTALGPIYLAYGRADGDYDRLYFSLGTVF